MTLSELPTMFRMALVTCHCALQLGFTKANIFMSICWDDDDKAERLRRREAGRDRVQHRGRLARPK